MKHLVLLVTGIILLSSSIACYPALILLDQIAVIVDSDVIMQSEVKARTKAIKTQISNSPNGTLPADDVLTAQVIERLVVESLQIQMADRRGIRVSDAELNEALQSISAQNGLNLTQFRQAIEQDGISYPEMRDQIRRELKMNRLQQGIMRNRIRISEQQIKNFLDTEVGGVITADEYRVAHILLPNPADANAKQIAAVKQQADAVRKRLDEGADFQSLAVERSAGKNALEGGDLGWRKPGQLPTMFSDVAQEMEIGEVRGPIKSGSGYHLIKLIQKRGAKAEGNVEQTRVRHVLVRPSEIRTNEEARELAESLQEEVVEGRAFDEIAKLHSDDPGSALSGGDLGWSRAGVFVPKFEEMMNTLDLNKVSPVFRTEHGYHFLEVTGRRVEDFSERFKQRQAENYLRNQMFDEELEAWLREIREEAFVEIRS
ncbi:MAG: molecular chaperone SurA [Gammaproteobacteria bacterium]|jgi:peptidyl-prolyl cis-trans isomerase SurA|nr:molecular chaperone SurA [Gammaproteobacteria bacterium]|tara:strand:- start:319 stop:1608 length:1290 start_codon:yes stop_codon:yes gene_type:complete